MASLSSLVYCLWARPGTYPRVEHLSTWVGFCLNRKRYTKLITFAGDKHSNLLWKFVTYSRKKFYNIFRISATYGIRTTSYREILYFNDDDETGDRVFISNGKRTNTRRDREREKRESASVAQRRREASVYIHKQSWVETHLISICWSASLIN